MNLYPEQLRAILTYIDALNEAEKKVIELQEKCGYGLPYPKMVLEDSDGGKYGRLVDEIGGSWSWSPDITDG